METKTVKIGKIEYTIRRANFGIDNAILDASSAIDLVTGKILAKSGTRRHVTIKLCVVKPEMTDKQIQELTPDEGGELFIEIEKFRNPLPLSKKPNSSVDTEESNSKQAKQE